MNFYNTRRLVNKVSPLFYCENFIFAPTEKIIFLPKIRYSLFHLISASSLRTSISFVICLSDSSKAFFKPSLGSVHFSTSTLPLLNLTLSVDKFTLFINLHKQNIFPHFSCATIYHLKRPHVLVHCILYKYLNPNKASLSMLLSNSLTFPSVIPLPTPHQSCCKSLFISFNPHSSTSLLSLCKWLHLFRREEAMKYNFHQLLSFPPLYIFHLLHLPLYLHATYYKMPLLPIP